MEKYRMFLQMFAGEEGAAAMPAGGDTGTGAAENPAAAGGDFSVGQKMADGTTVANAKVAAALNRQMKRHPEMRQVLARNQGAQVPQAQPAQAMPQVPQGQPAQMPAQTAEGQPDAEAERRAKFEELIKGEYRDLYGEKVGATIKDRLKNQSDAVQKLQSIQPTLDLMMKKAGVNSFEELQSILQNDESLLEEEAEERGMSMEALKQVKALEAENERLTKAEEDAKRQEHFHDLQRQAEAMREIYPGFDLIAELNGSEKFRKMTMPGSGYTVEDAYMVVHGKDLMAQAMAFGMDRTRQQYGQTVQAQRARPGEGAMSGKSQAAAAEPRLNPAAMTKAERRKFKDYIKAHPERTVSFD